MRNGMMLSKLDKKVLHDIVTIVVEQTGMVVTEGTFRYAVKDVARQLAFGGDFTYGFGDFFKLVFVRFGTRRSEEEADRYDTLFRLSVELDNSKNRGRKDDKPNLTRERIAKEAEEKLEEYLKESGLAVELPEEAVCAVPGFSTRPG